MFLQMQKQCHIWIEDTFHCASTIQIYSSYIKLILAATNRCLCGNSCICFLVQNLMMCIFHKPYILDLAQSVLSLNRNEGTFLLLVTFRAGNNVLCRTSANEIQKSLYLEEKYAHLALVQRGRY